MTIFLIYLRIIGLILLSFLFSLILCNLYIFLLVKVKKLLFEKPSYAGTDKGQNRDDEVYSPYIMGKLIYYLIRGVRKIPTQCLYIIKCYQNQYAHGNKQNGSGNLESLFHTDNSNIGDADASTKRESNQRQWGLCTIT
jgi:hypothetical protein